MNISELLQYYEGEILALSAEERALKLKHLNELIKRKHEIEDKSDAIDDAAAEFSED